VRCFLQVLNDIINNLTDDYHVQEVRTCTYWTAVVSRNCGLASTLRDECPTEHAKPVKDVGNLTEKNAKELSCYVQSDQLLEATIGMAAINSLIEVDESKCVELNAFSVIAEKGQDKNIAVIGR